MKTPAGDRREEALAQTRASSERVDDQTERYELAATNLIDVNFRLVPGERVAFVHGRNKGTFGRTLGQVCAARSIEYVSVPVTVEKSFELPRYIQDRFVGCSAVLISTSRSYTHSVGVRRAAAAGVRFATNSQLDEQQLIDGLLADYELVAQRATYYAALLERARSVCIRSRNGAELRFDIRNQRGLMETGLFTRPGEVSNLPSGEAACGIDEGTGRGVLMVDGSFPQLGLLKTPLELRFRDGEVIEVLGDRSAELIEILEANGRASRYLAELGVGVNSSCQVVGKAVIDEKVAGTLHVAIGNDIGFGGRNAVGYHADGVLITAELYLDGEKVELPG